MSGQMGRSDRVGSTSMLRPIDVSAPPEARIAQRGGQALLSVVLQGGVRFLTSFLVGRFTNPANLALVSSGMSLANLLALAWPTTVGAAASRFIARSRGEGSDINAVANFMGIRTLQSSALLSLGAVPIWMLLGGSAAEGLIVAFLVTTFSCYSFTRGVHYGAGQTSRQLKWDVLTSSVSICGVLLVLLASLPSILVLGVLAFSYGAYALACWPWGARGSLARPTRREIDAFVAWGSLGTVASAGFAQFAMLVAVATAGRAEAGQFAAAMVLAAPAAMIANSLAQILFPTMAEAFGRGDRAAVDQQLDKSTRVLAAVMVLIFGVVVISARPLVQGLWGSHYSDAAMLIPLLLLPAMLRSVASPSQGAISIASRGGIAYSSLVSVVGSGFGAAVWTFMPDAWGVTGVAAGYALGTTLIAAAVYVRAWLRHQQGWTLLTTTLVAVTALIGATSWQLVYQSPPLAVDLALALSFAAGWCLLQRRQIAQMVKLVRKRS